MFDFDVREIGDGRDADIARSRLSGEALALRAVRLDVAISQLPRGPALTLSRETG